MVTRTRPLYHHGDSDSTTITMVTRTESFEVLIIPCLARTTMLQKLKKYYITAQLVGVMCPTAGSAKNLILARVVYFHTDSVNFLHYLFLLAQLFSGYIFLLFFVTDINECTLGLHTCQQACTNNEGSYDCSCFDGFTLHANGSCVGK